MESSAPIAPMTDGGGVGLPSAELLAAASHSYLTSVAHLTVGLWLLKFPFSEKGGAPQRRFLWYGVDDVDGDCLFWNETEKKKRSKSKAIPLSGVTGVLEAAQTAAFKKALDDRRMDKAALPCCFSIVCGKRTLDLQAATVDERDHFIAALHCVMTHKQLNRKQQAVAVATARRSSIAAAHAISTALNSPTSPLTSPLSSPSSPSPPTTQQPRSDLFVISVKARNLPIMPWRTDDESNDTLISIFDKNSRTQGQFAFVESSEWQPSNAMPNFRTPLLVPVTLPIEPSDLIKIIAYDHTQDDAHIVGQVVVRAEFFMKNAGHEMMVKLKHTTNKAVDDLLNTNNTYLLLTSTCKTGGGRAGSRAPPPVAPATRQQFGNVMHEFQTAIKGTAGGARAPVVSAEAGAKVTAHLRTQSAVPAAAKKAAGEEVMEDGVRRLAPAAKRPSMAEEVVVPSKDVGRPRESSVQLPRTVLSFLQAGDVFTFYPPRRGIDAVTRPLNGPFKVSVRLQMKGAFGHLLLAEADDDGSDDDAASPSSSAAVLSIPFELVFQAKVGTAPGCFHLGNASPPRRPKAARCLSLVIKTSAARDAKVHYWLDLECRSKGVRDAWVQAVTEVNAYIHTPVRKRAPSLKKVLEVDTEPLATSQPTSPLPTSPIPAPNAKKAWGGAAAPATSAPPPAAAEEDPAGREASTSEAPAVNWGGDTQSISGRLSPSGSLDGGVALPTMPGALSLPGGLSAPSPLSGASRPSALSFLDPPPEKRSAVDVARKLAKTMGMSNVLDSTPSLPPSAKDLNPPIIPQAPPSPSSSPPTAPPLAPPIAPPLAPPLDDISDGIPAPPPLDGVPPPPPMGGPGGAAPSRGGPRLRRLHWYAVGDGVEGTVWSERDEEVEGVGSAVWADGQAMLVSMFALAEAKVGAGGGWGKAGGARKAKEEEAEKAPRIFDAKRAQNIEIALRAFRMPNAALHEAVLGMDMTILNAERLSSLLQCAPTHDELQAMRRWEAKQPQGASPIDYSTLGKAEQFTFLMQSIPHYTLRLRGMLFRLRYNELVDQLIKQFHRLTRACRAVRDSRRFRRALRVILTVGNVMNRSGAAGFHLQSLDELGRTKSGDGKMNLVDFIVAYLHLLQTRKEGEGGGEDGGVVGEGAGAGSYLADLSTALAQVTLIDVAGLVEERQVIMQGLSELETEVARLREQDAAVEGDEWVEQMTEFVEEAGGRRALLDDAWRAYEGAGGDLLSYLNEVGEMGVSEVFAVLARFCDAMAAAEGRRVERAKKEREEAEKGVAKHRRMQTEPPPSTTAGNSSLASMLANVSVSDALKAHADKMREVTWED